MCVWCLSGVRFVDKRMISLVCEFFLKNYVKVAAMAQFLLLDVGSETC